MKINLSFTFCVIVVFLSSCEEILREMISFSTKIGSIPHILVSSGHHT